MIMIDLDNSWRITLYDNKNRSYVQFIEHEDADIAIKKAKNSFNAHLYDLCKKNTGVDFQKACSISIEPKRLLFGFKGGHITIEADNKTIFDMLKEAQEHSFVEGLSIKEISSEMHYYI